MDIGNVADAALLIDLLTSGPDARSRRRHDPGRLPRIPVPTGDPDTLRGLRVGVPGGYPGANTPEVEVQEILEQAGAPLVPSRLLTLMWPRPLASSP